MIALRLLAAFLLAALVGALFGWRRTSRQFVDYRTENAPSVELAEARCPASGLIAHWPLDAEEGGFFRDRSGLGHDLAPRTSFAPLAALRFGPVRVEAGRSGHGVSLRRHQWLVGPNSRCFVTPTLSVAAWVCLTAAVDVPTIVGKSTWPSDGFWLLATSSPPLDSSRRLQLGLASEDGVTHVDADYMLPLGQWHHVAVSLDAAAREVRFYIDGVQRGDVHRDVPAWRVNTTHPFVVGDYDDTGRWPWSGGIDDVRVWNTVASPAEIASAFREGGGQSGRTACTSP